MKNIIFSGIFQYLRYRPSENS